MSFVVIAFAYWRGRIDVSALFASGLVGIIVMFFLLEDWPFIYLVIGFFAFGNLVTRYRYSIKEEYRVAEGVRSFRNVFGNGGAATIFSILFFFTGLPVLLLGVVGSMATAMADTFATEVGQAHEKKPWLITTWKRVEVGRSGAVSIYGLIASFFGAALISSIPLFFGGTFELLFVGAFAGFFGCNVDSLIGATIERKKLDKHMTNFIATTIGGLAAVFFGCYFGFFI